MKRFGKLITLVLVVAMALSLMSVAALAAASSDYKDVVAGKWYVQYVDWALENDFMTGISDTEWAPNTATTRGMVIQTLYKMAGAPEVEGESPFADVAEGKYYTDAVKWAVEAGVTSGKSTDEFKPDDVLTRQEAVTFFKAFAEKVWGLDVSDVSNMNRFEDTADVAKYAKDSMGWAVKAKVIDGSKEHDKLYLMPKRDITRAELATMLKALKALEIPVPPTPTVVPDKIGYGTVKVKVVASDKAVQGVSFSLTGKDNDENEISRTATSGADGIAEFKEVPASNKDGYSIVATNADVRYGAQTPVTGVAVAPKKTTDVNYELKEQGGSVTVVVNATDAATKARAILTGVPVFLSGKTNDNQYFSRTLNTNANGEVTFKEVPAGKYVIAKITEKPNDGIGDAKYKEYQTRYSAPTKELVADEQTFEVVDSAVTVTQTLKVPSEVKKFSIAVEVTATNKEFFKDLSGYQVLVTGESAYGEKINIASNYTNKEGKVTVVNVPMSKKGTKYKVELLNAPSYVTVKATGNEVEVNKDCKVSFALTMKTGKVEVKVIDKDTGKVMRKGTKVTVTGVTADGKDFTATTQISDNDGFATLKNVPFSDENGYDVFVDGEYAVAQNANFVFATTGTYDVDVYVTKNFSAVDVTLNLKQQTGKDSEGKPVYKTVSAAGYKFKLVGTTTYGDELTLTSGKTNASGEVSFTKVPFGVYKIAAVGLDDVASLTVKVDNEVTLDDTATTNNTVIVDAKNTKNVKVTVNGILKVSPKVTVHYMYRDVEITGIDTQIQVVDKKAAALSAKSTEKGAVFTYVPAGKYQLTINGKEASDSPAYETDMYVYEVIQGQETVFDVSDGVVDVYINLSRTTK